MSDSDMPEVAAIMERLAEPFDLDEVKFKPAVVNGNRALALAYVDARVIQDRLDEVLGVAGWQDEYESMPDGSVVCRLRLRLGGEWITKMDVGGQSEQPDEGDRRKAAFSDALKRAAVKFGVGRYLYRLPQLWADYDPQKRQFKSKPTLPASAMPKKPAQQPTPEKKPQQAQQQPAQPVAEKKPDQPKKPAEEMAELIKQYGEPAIRQRLLANLEGRGVSLARVLAHVGIDAAEKIDADGLLMLRTCLLALEAGKAVDGIFPQPKKATKRNPSIPVSKATQKQQADLQRLAGLLRMTNDDLREMLAPFKVAFWAELSVEDADELIKRLTDEVRAIGKA